MEIKHYICEERPKDDFYNANDYDIPFSKNIIPKDYKYFVLECSENDKFKNNGINFSKDFEYSFNTETKMVFNSENNQKKLSFFYSENWIPLMTIFISELNSTQETKIYLNLPKPDKKTCDAFDYIFDFDFGKSKLEICKSIEGSIVFHLKILRSGVWEYVLFFKVSLDDFQKCFEYILESI